MESDSVLYGLLGRIHLLMRRVTNRITDVEYMRTNKDYAREIVRLANETGHEELMDLAGRLRAALGAFGLQQHRQPGTTKAEAEGVEHAQTRLARPSSGSKIHSIRRRRSSSTSASSCMPGASACSRP